MAEIDYLNQRTSNINIRISPMLKTQLIEQGAIQGLNLSDYVMHILTVEMSGGSKNKILTSDEYTELTEENEILQAQLDVLLKEQKTLTSANEKLTKSLSDYDNLIRDYKPFIGNIALVGDEKIEMKTHFDVIKTCLKSVRYNITK